MDIQTDSTVMANTVWSFYVQDPASRWHDILHC